MSLKLFIIFFLMICFTHQAFVNKNRVNITSNLTIFYRFTDDNKIYLTFSAQNNGGWVAMGFGNTQSNIDIIRVYINTANSSAAVQDLYSTGDFLWVDDATLFGGTDDLKLEGGTRTNGVLNITVSRIWKTGDDYDYVIVPPITVKCLFFWGPSDDITQKYINNPSPLNVYLSTIQVCNTFCATLNMTCVGPDVGDCVCPSGTFLNSTSGACMSCIGNCSVCTDTKSCTTCASNYFYQASPLQCTLCTDGDQYKNTGAGTCTVCDANCQICASDINCGTCKAGYFLNINNKCTACIANCSTCTTTTDCQACLPGFFYANGQCSACPQNCNNCSDANTCTQCINNYYFSGSTCVNCSSLGLKKTGASNGTGTCQACVSGCLVCDTTTSCTQCGDGYLATGTTACNPCTVTSCKTCNPLSTCTSCLANYILFSNTCVQCSVPNCQGCDSNGKCLACNAGFILFNGVCSNCSVSNCAYCGSDPTVCVYCSNGYYLTPNGTCYPGTVQSCVVPWGNTSCTACDTGFLLASNACYQCSGKNCLTCSSNNICSQCGVQYFLQNNLCSKCIANCDSCFDQSTCSLCSTGYYLSSSTQCSRCSVNNCQTCNSNPTKCDQCLAQFFLSGDKLTCSTCSDPNCLTCSTAAVCTACNAGYYLNQSSCVACAQTNCASCSSAAKCDQCKTNYTANLAQTSCSYCPFQTCQRCDSNFQCAACTPQYFFNNNSNSCISCQSNCINCTDPSICTSCSSGYYLNNITCLACSSNCAQCNSTSCITCSSGYGLNSQGQCITCNVPNCLSCSSNNVCSQCSSGLTLNLASNTCGCSAAQLWNSSAQICLTCSNLYTNCYSCNQTACISCIPGYYQPTGSGSCIKCNQDANCGVCNTTNCLSCVTGYYLQPNNTCSACFVDCANCTGSAHNQCTVCNSGFALFGSTNQCATSNCPNSFSNCQSCVRNNAGNLVCVGCNAGYFLSPDTGLCDYCHPSCLTCNGKTSSDCLSCPSYSLFYSNLGICAYNCSKNCLTCDGSGTTNCLSCANSLILLNKQCVTTDAALQNISNFTANTTGFTPNIVTYAEAIRSFTQRTASTQKSCNNNTDCFNNGECYQNVCLCKTGFLGIQCQISQSDLAVAINKKNDILIYLISALSNLNTAGIQTSGNTSRILDNTTNTTSNTSNSSNSSNTSSNNGNTSTSASAVNSSTLQITLATIVELATPIELWTTANSINTTIIFMNQLIRSNIAAFNQTIITTALQALSNMVYVLNNYNRSVVSMVRSDEVNLYQNITITTQIIINTTLSSLTSVGNTYQIYTPYLKVSLNYIDLSSSQSPKFTLYSNPYYDSNDVYMTQVSFTADSTSLITKINGGNPKVLLKQTAWISANPLPEDKNQQVNLTLATGISSIEIYKTTGDYLPITGITDLVAVRTKKITPSNPLDTTNTQDRYACAYWDNSSSIWSMDGLDNDRTTDSQNYLGCYTNHFTYFTVVYRNQTDFFALQFVEVPLKL